MNSNGHNPIPTTKSPGPPPRQPCRHEYVFLRSVNLTIGMVDTFYCTKCIKYRYFLKGEEMTYEKLEETLKRDTAERVRY